MNLKRVMLLSLIALAATASACSKKDKGKGKDDDTQTAAGGSDENKAALDYRARQQAFADSVLNTSSNAKSVADKLGKGYGVGSTRLRDTLAVLVASGKDECFKAGRNTDPYLAGTVSFFVNMGVIGSDIVRIQESKWTSAAGNIVDACLNKAAQSWKFDGTFGKPAAYIVQVQFRLVPPIVGDSALKIRSRPASAVKKS
jgi:hypothetical protein